MTDVGGELGRGRGRGKGKKMRGGRTTRYDKKRNENRTKGELMKMQYNAARGQSAQRTEKTMGISRKMKTEMGLGEKLQDKRWHQNKICESKSLRLRSGEKRMKAGK